ncbi:beta-galactosidase-1-like protein 2 [Uloborus diversus]|uniref:beta-galactosidase-1-like protein 2 n=1 Tax=Uloborus diversus TaxID=327109 RepID=UPI00240A1AB2|nr:beta-galactosidase-1-like protein 2 [Uloborus diversus]
MLLENFCLKSSKSSVSNTWKNMNSVQWEEEETECPTLYQFYTTGGIKYGLEATGDEFKLNNKLFKIFSGSLHYFRILPERWSTSIRLMRQCNLNTVCTYVPWNLHEVSPGNYDFKGLLDLKSFIEKVQREDMFLILRPGPYICAEVDLGGLPSWLLKDDIKLRSNDKKFISAVSCYFKELLQIVSKYQFSVTGGPIIAVQVENEFASYGNTQQNIDDLQYMTFLKDLLIESGIKELLFTCDMPSLGLLPGSIEGTLMTANFQTDVDKELSILKQHQPDKPLMVTEFWSGWFDHWNEKHEEIPLDTYISSLKAILKNNASFNIYVFQGGTNFGFINGANIGFPLPDSPYTCTITSYDYGAPLTEDGRCTEKYFATFMLLKEIELGYNRPKSLPFSDVSHINMNDNYLNVNNIAVSKFLPLDKLLSTVKEYKKAKPLLMEMLDEVYGQQFGFIYYQTKLKQEGRLKFTAGHGTRTIVLVNKTPIAVVMGSDRCHETQIDSSLLCKTENTLGLLVENLGRINFTNKNVILNNERRGIGENITINGEQLLKWSMYSLDFSSKFMHDIMLLDWSAIEDKSEGTIALYRASLNLDTVKDTFITSNSWTKGIVIVNSFNIGRYWKVGPQQTLFLPKELLKQGLNEILAFELHGKIEHFEFKHYPVLNSN